MVSCGGKNGGKDVKLETKLDSVSYALGIMSSSQQFKMTKKGLKKDLGLDLNESAFMKGFENAVDSTDFKMTSEVATKFLNEFFENQRKLAFFKDCNGFCELRNWS